MFLNTFILPLRTWVLTAFTFTLKSFSTAALISGLLASRTTLNTT